MFDRVHFAARGHNGGGAGALGRVALDDGTALRGKGKQQIPAGRRLILDLPGGGGNGDAALRPAALVQRDVAYGYISAEQAKADYAQARPLNPA